MDSLSSSRTMGIRIKFLGLITLATLLPLLASVFIIQSVGYDYLVSEKGSNQAREAEHWAESFAQLTRQHIEEFRNFLHYSNLAASTRKTRQGLDTPAIESLEAQWPALTPQSPRLQAYLRNPCADLLRDFQLIHPEFAEILVTDAEGRLLAATGKTTDYYQADEEWWQETSKLRQRAIWIEGIHLDQSSKVFSLDICIPLFDNQDGKILGVVKAVLNAAPFYSEFIPADTSENYQYEILSGSGAVLLKLNNPTYIPETESYAGMGALDGSRSLWKLLNHPEETLGRMVGVAPLNLAVDGVTSAAEQNRPDLFLSVSRPAREMLEPIRKQLLYITLCGSALVCLFLAIGLFVADRHIVRRIKLVELAATMLSPVPGSGQNRYSRSKQSPWNAANLSGKLEADRGKDEIGSLSRAFGRMAKRVIHYQEEMQEEIRARTDEIQKDLDSAKKFQEALMPQMDPVITSTLESSQIHINVHQYYKPSLILGGDFFDVVKIDNHRVAFMIADVMGHGAKSALITAVFKTLIQQCDRQAADPVQMLETLNREFYKVIARTGETVFVTLFYMVLDIERIEATYASAGHPSPIIASRKTGKVRPLFTDLRDNPALGLYPVSTYSSHSLKLDKGDLVCLYTDGVVEALDEKGTQFGMENLRTSIEDFLACPGQGTITEHIARDVQSHSRNRSQKDDICLIGIEILNKPSSASIRHERIEHCL